MRRPPDGAAIDVDHVDRGLARLATRQCGVVARAQLAALGVQRGALEHWIRTGRLIPIHRGVYAVGHAALSDRGRIIAALLAAGPRAVASHRTAAFLYGLLATLPAVLDVTVTAGARRSRTGLIVHGTTRPPETRTRHGIIVTSPVRTLDDLKRTRPADEVERITAEALVLRVVTQQEVDALFEAPPAATRSELERRMLRIVTAAGLPRPLVNHPTGRYVADFAWPAQRLILETDGYDAHGPRARFESDRARDAALLAAGWSVLRITWRQLDEAPLKVAATLASTLAARGSPGPAA